MNSLILGAQYITEADRRHLTFCGAQVTEQYIRDFSEKISISDACLTCIAMFPAHQVLRLAILYAFAAMKSADFTERTVYGFRISIRSNYINEGQVFLDVDNQNIIYAAACGTGIQKWQICYLNPLVFNEEYVYGNILIAAVLKACNEVYCINRNQ